MDNYTKILEIVGAMDITRIILITTCVALLVGLWRLPDIIRAIRETKEK